MAPPRSSRITKSTPRTSTTPRMTRHRSRMSSASSSGGKIQRMMDEVAASLDPQTSSPSCDQMMEEAEWSFVDEDEVTPFNSMEHTSQDSFEVISKPDGKGKARLVDGQTDFTFPIMQLPTEIRLEIYRACLVRPRKILLSKAEKPPQAEKSVVEATQEEQTSVIMEERSLFGSFDLAGVNRIAPSIGHATSSSFSTFEATPQSASTGRVPQRRWRSRSSLHNRPQSRSLSTPSSSGSSAGSSSGVLVLPSSNSDMFLASSPPLAPERWEPIAPSYHSSSATTPKRNDSLVINILRTSKEIYREARDVLYSENVFEIDLNTALTSLAALHQRSRRHIKHIELEIPTYTEILERFSEVVRLNLRYCTGLKTLVIRTPFTLPGAEGSTAASNTTVYANGFDILRWLPQQCQVVLEGCHNPEIDAVVGKHLNLARTQDKVAYAARMFWSDKHTKN